MTNKFSTFTEVTSLNNSDTVPLARSSANYRITWANLKALVQRFELALSGSLIGVRKRVNLVPGGNVSIAAADDSVNEDVDVTIGFAVEISDTEPAAPTPGMLWLDTGA